MSQPPSGGCVLKHSFYIMRVINAQPAAFGRLCVETTTNVENVTYEGTSRLRAAVC